MSCFATAGVLTSLVLAGCANVPNDQACLAGIEEAHDSAISLDYRYLPLYVRSAQSRARVGDYQGCVRYLQLARTESELSGRTDSAGSRENYQEVLESRIPEHRPPPRE